MKIGDRVKVDDTIELVPSRVGTIVEQYHLVAGTGKAWIVKLDSGGRDWVFWRIR